MSLTTNKPRFTYLILLITLVVWASAYVGIRAGVKSFDPGSLALFRYLIASVVMLVCNLIKNGGRLKIPSKNDLLIFAVVGFFGFALYNIMLNYGEVTVTSGAASFILSIQPFVITLFAVIFLHEHLSALGWSAMLVCIIGVGLICVGESESFALDSGLIWVLISTLCSCIYSTLQKKILHRVDPFELTSYAIWFGTLQMMFYFPRLIHEIPHVPFSATLIVIYLGIFPAAVGYLGWTYLLKHMPMTKLGAYLYIMPLITVLMGWWLLAEQPNGWIISGGLISLVASFVLSKQVRLKNIDSNSEIAIESNKH